MLPPYVLICLALSAFAQSHESDAKKIYIPLSIEDAISELKKVLPPDQIAKLQSDPEDDMVLYHHGLGTWIRNEWGLWKGSRLRDYFYELGIYHPDDMSGTILTSFKRHLDGKPLQISSQVRQTRTAWARGGAGHFWCPWDESKVPVRAYLPGVLRDGIPARIHIGRCSANGHLWASQYERQVFRPAGPLLQQVRAAERVAAPTRATTSSALGAIS